MSKDNLLFIYTHKSTFVENDIRILQKEHCVYEYRFNNSSSINLITSLIKLILFLITNFFKFNLIYIWFADYHSLIPTLYSYLRGIKCYIVIGGYDICRERRYNYGSFNSWYRGFFAIKSMRYATLNLCVSKYVYRTVKAICPKCKAQIVYNGVEIATKNSVLKDRGVGVLMVALVSRKQTLYIKGIDRLFNLAIATPLLNFTLVGCNYNLIKENFKNIPNNINLIPYLPKQQLDQMYRNSHVYCQLSRRESFSLSLAEAMSYGCIPFISNVGGMAEVTNNFGIKVSQLELDNHIENISDTLLSLYNSSLKNEEYKTHIIRNFSLDSREKALKKAIYN